MWTKVAFVVGLALSLDYLGFDTPTIFNPTWISLACLLSAKRPVYTFNMGNGNFILHENYKVAANALMERNMPAILHNRQTEVVFLPESHLPKVPRLVDLRAYEANKRSLSDEKLAFLGMKKGREDITNAVGDIAEKDLAEELRKFYANDNVVVLQGGIFRVPGKGKGAIEEHDFVIIHRSIS